MSKLIDEGQYLMHCIIRKQNQINLTAEETLKYNAILSEWNLDETEIIDIWLEHKETTKGRTNAVKTAAGLALLKSLESKPDDTEEEKERKLKLIFLITLFVMENAIKES